LQQFDGDAWIPEVRKQEHEERGKIYKYVKKENMEIKSVTSAAGGRKCHRKNVRKLDSAELTRYVFVKTYRPQIKKS